jgi:hypothetical protein
MTIPPLLSNIYRRNHAEQAGIPGRLSVSESEWYAWYRCYATPMKMRMRDYPRYAAA